MIPPNKTYLPPREEYQSYLEDIWKSGWVTNDGQMLRTLEARLTEFLGADHVRLVANGTLALQLAIRVLELEGEVITTPFSYVATTGALLWEHCEPVFVDIDPHTFNLDAGGVEDAITPDTCALLPTHVFGVPCDVQALRTIADQHGLRVVYDGAHAFGTERDGRSLLLRGDLTATSFHATKLFHTVEGGALVTDDPDLAEQIDLLRAFGHRENDHFRNGINAKNSELHAAMGLCLLPRMEAFIEQRRALYAMYREHLQHLPLTFQHIPEKDTYNYAYFPVLFPSHACMMTVKERLARREIYARRYFWPALNRLPYVEAPPCPVAERVAARILCLSFFQEITAAQVRQVAAAIDEAWPAGD
jgi:dTDP-4-amino-4,6-dideoxygalactose transaminase